MRKKNIVESETGFNGAYFAVRASTPLSMKAAGLSVKVGETQDGRSSVLIDSSQNSVWQSVFAIQVISERIQPEIVFCFGLFDEESG